MYVFVKMTRIMYKWANEWMNDGYYCMDEKEKFVINGRLHRMAASANSDRTVSISFISGIKRLFRQVVGTVDRQLVTL